MESLFAQGHSQRPSSQQTMATSLPSAQASRATWMLGRFFHVFGKRSEDGLGFGGTVLHPEGGVFAGLTGHPRPRPETEAGTSSRKDSLQKTKHKPETRLTCLFITFSLKRNMVSDKKSLHPSRCAWQTPCQWGPGKPLLRALVVC